MRGVLSDPRLYRLFQRLLGGESSARRIVDEYVGLEPGGSVLDLGCGPAELLELLPSAGHYLGVDLSQAYVEAARARYGARGAEFLCADLAAAPLDLGERRFDVAIAAGLLHHLDDRGVATVLETAVRALRPDGHLVTIDTVVEESGQPRIARRLAKMDRGEHVRPLAAYEKLAATRFASVRATLRHDLLRIPYSHAIMVCAEPLPAPGERSAQAEARTGG